MLYQRLRGLTITCGLATALLCVPAESNACCDWLFGGWGARTTYRAPYYAPASAATYAPVYGAPACTSCAPQTVSYLPQTYYRTVYRPVPVTTYGAFSACDPCTGGLVTYYRPVTSWAYQAAWVPYTTYRIVYSDACSPCVSGNGCFSCAPSIQSAPVVGGACCGQGTTPSEGLGAGTTAPSITSTPAGGQTPEGQAVPNQLKTYKEQSAPSGEKLNPKPDPNTSSSPGPNLPDPGSHTALRPAASSPRYHLIASPEGPAADSRLQIDTGGWRVSRE